ncbi:hypothetical protein VTI74DRAFT_7574 [Chaetomium olivicolor]
MLANFGTPLEMDGLGIDHRHPYQHQQHHNHGRFASAQLPTTQHVRKRKAEVPPENNERLSKRMSLLNLEQSGQKHYVPVENTKSSSSASRKPTNDDDSVMHLDDTKYKVYIYNLDDELSSDNESDSAGKLVFLPDIEKHLRRTNRLPLPTRVLDPRPDPAAELAGKELVLYSVPKAISVPEEQDSVRRAIIEARARAREKARLEREQAAQQAAAAAAVVPVVASSVGSGLGDVAMDSDAASSAGYDPDAMELD